MRAIWKGAISFGLVNVPVRVYSATESHDLPLHQVHARDGGRIRYQRRCTECGEVVEFEDIERAWDDGERRVVLTEEDFDLLPAERSHEIEVVEFVPDSQVDILRMDKSYYLEPDAKALKPYTLLRRALEETERTAIARFALRRKTRLAALRVRDDVLVLQTLLWDDEVRQPAFDVLSDTVKISAKERDIAGQLVESMSTDFDASAFTDEYQEQLRALVDKKLQAGDTVTVDDASREATDEDTGEVIDLMEALRKSIAQRKDAKEAPKKGTAKAPKKPAKKATKSRKGA